MTDIPRFPAADDPLDHAADALRRAAVPEGPPEETILRTVAALRVASETNTVPFYRRKFMRYAVKIAAVVLVAVGGAICFTGILPLRSPLAFAEVAAKLRDARTLTYEVTFKDPEQKEPTKMKVFYKDPGWMRSEGAGAICISDLRQGKPLGSKQLFLDPAAKMAMLIDYKRADKAKKKDAASAIEELRKLADKKGESVGKKQIGDVEAVGFRVQEDGFPLTVWADPKTKTPVLIEMSIPVGNKETLSTMSNFQLDTKLDDSLFSLEPPEGYKLRKMETKEEKPETDVVHLLRAYAEKSSGQFPKSLSITSTEWQTYLKKQWGGKKGKGLPDSEAVKFIQTAMRIEIFLHKDKDHGYNPDGVKLGDRDKIVFWYRTDKADKYRAVYGDLHIADVSADQLPEKLKK